MIGGYGPKPTSYDNPDKDSYARTPLDLSSANFGGYRPMRNAAEMGVIRRGEGLTRESTATTIDTRDFRFRNKETP
jgi:hypothetical protein